jgi:putative ATPase
MKQVGYGKGYKYAHDFENKIADMECLPGNLKGRRYYVPTSQGLEKSLGERIEYLKKLKSGGR